MQYVVALCLAAIVLCAMLSYLGWVLTLALIIGIPIGIAMIVAESNLTPEERERRDEARRRRKEMEMEEERTRRMQQMELEHAQRMRAAQNKSAIAGTLGKIAIGVAVKAITGHHHKDL